MPAGTAPNSQELLVSAEIFLEDRTRVYNIPGVSVLAQCLWSRFLHVIAIYAILPGLKNINGFIVANNPNAHHPDNG